VGLSECVLRIREGDPNARKHLTDTFSRLFAIYGESARFECYYTCNAVLVGSLDQQFSLWHGQTFGEDRAARERHQGREQEEEEEEEEEDHGTRRKMVKFNDSRSDQPDYQGFDEVRNLGDVEYLPIVFSAAEFERLFLLNHDQSGISVHSIVNYIYIIRHYMGDFGRQRTRANQNIQKLF
jgi:hypothetical protein